MVLTVVYTRDTPIYRVNYIRHSNANNHPTTITINFKLLSIFSYELTAAPRKHTPKQTITVKIRKIPLIRHFVYRKVCSNGTFLPLRTTSHYFTGSFNSLSNSSAHPLPLCSHNGVSFEETALIVSRSGLHQNRRGLSDTTIHY